MSPVVAAMAIKCCSSVVTLARILFIGWSHLLLVLASITANDNKGVLAYLVCAPSRDGIGGVPGNDLKKTGMSGVCSSWDFDGRNNWRAVKAACSHVATIIFDRVCDL